MARKRVKRHRFPVHLAEHVSKVWDTWVQGTGYQRPGLPSKQQLTSLLEVAYLASMEREEARSLRFMISCAPEGQTLRRHVEGGQVRCWAFDDERPFGLQELRRLCVATNADRSAIWVQFPDAPNAPLSIRGLLDLGASWSVARRALAYHYASLPDALHVRALGPGHMTLYQGHFSLATLRAGQIEIKPAGPFLDILGLYPFLHDGLAALSDRITPPEEEPAREWEEFQFGAYVNTLLAVVNLIQEAGHGGALILVRSQADAGSLKPLRFKYRFAPAADGMGQSYVDCMNIRHRLGDHTWTAEERGQDLVDDREAELGSYRFDQAHSELVDACSFVAGLAGADGAVVLRSDLSVLGFGAEILLDKAREAIVYKATEPMKRDPHPLDSEQFGMRHRSAMRLCAAVPDIAVIVVSQDGAISLVWNQEGEVWFRQGITTTHATLGLT